MDRCKISQWEVVLGAPDRVNIPCLIHDTRLCQYEVKMTHNSPLNNVNTKPVMTVNNACLEE